MLLAEAGMDPAWLELEITETELMADPTNTTLKMFDTNGDGTVSAAEIEANPTISAFLSPDVQLFDGALDGALRVVAYGEIQPDTGTLPVR